MEILDLAIEILKDIEENDTPFNDALRKMFRENPNIRQYRKDVAGLVGCALRHWMLFQKLLEDVGAEPVEKRVAMILLGDAFFYKHVDVNELREAAKPKMNEELLEKVDSLIEKSAKGENYMPANIKQGSIEYLSIRYNTPMWVLKTWRNFGYAGVYKTLRKNTRPAVPSLRIRESAVNFEDVDKREDFQKTPVEGIYSYTGKLPYRKLEWFEKGYAFLEKPGIKSILDQYKISEPMEAFLYSDNGSIHKELIETYGPSIGLNLGCSDGLEKHADVSRLIKGKNLRNVNFFSANPDSLEASISRPQDLVIVAPPSSEFDSIRENPDFFIHFKPEQLDAIIEKEKAFLEGVDPFVAEDGILIYMVTTMSKKESTFVIQDFIRNHASYKLEKEEQILPYNALDTAVYYAVLKKEADLAKATPPMGEIENAIAQNPTLSASSSKE